MIPSASFYVNQLEELGGEKGEPLLRSVPPTAATKKPNFVA